MHIFYIPSWYPHASNPLNGVFTAEQIEQMATYYPNYQYTLSLCGLGKYTLSLRHPFQIFKTINAFLADQRLECQTPSLLKLYYPGLNWSESILGGNITGLLKGHEINLLRSFQIYQPVKTLIHAHVAYPAGWIAMRLAEKYDLPYIITEHMGPFPLPKRAFIKKGKLTRLISEPILKAKHLISVSPTLSEQIQALTGRTIDLSVLPNALSGIWLDPPIRKISKKEFNLFCLALISPQKGFDSLLYAFKKAYEYNPLLRLSIGGEGPHLFRYQELSVTLGLRDVVTWLGRIEREQVPYYMSQADTFILTSRHESLGMVYIEAMACGVPIIATRCGGPENFVTSDIGQLVDVDNVSEIAEVILKTSQGYYTYDLDTIRQRFNNQFSAPVVTKRLDGIYRGIWA